MSVEMGRLRHNEVSKRIFELLNTHDLIMEMGFKGHLPFEEAMKKQAEIQSLIMDLRAKEVIV